LNLVLKKYAIYNAITSINNSLMQSKIILIGVTSSKLLFPEHFCWGSAASSPSGVWGGDPEAKAFLGFT